MDVQEISRNTGIPVRTIYNYLGKERKNRGYTYIYELRLKNIVEQNKNFKILKLQPTERFFLYLKIFWKLKQRIIADIMKEVERLYNLKASTLANRRSDGEGPAYIKNGECVLYGHSAIKKYLESMKQKTIDQP